MIDPDLVEADHREDGRWVPKTSTDDEPAELALGPKELWQVEDPFRPRKSLLGTRLIHHRWDETLRGQLFCSLRALRLRQELEDRLAARGRGDPEGASVIRDLDRVEEIELEQEARRFRLRPEAVGVAGKVLWAGEVALPPAVQPAAWVSPRAIGSRGPPAANVLRPGASPSSPRSRAWTLRLLTWKPGAVEASERRRGAPRPSPGAGPYEKRW